jgi:hypothetical protein
MAPRRQFEDDNEFVWTEPAQRLVGAVHHEIDAIGMLEALQRDDLILSVVGQVQVVFASKTPESAAITGVAIYRSRKRTEYTSCSIKSIDCFSSRRMFMASKYLLYPSGSMMTMTISSGQSGSRVCGL